MRWLHGLIERITGPVSFILKMEDGNKRHCHQDQLRQRVSTASKSTEEQQEDDVLSSGD